MVYAEARTWVVTYIKTFSQCLRMCSRLGRVWVTVWIAVQFLWVQRLLSLQNNSCLAICWVYSDFFVPYFLHLFCVASRERDCQHLKALKCTQGGLNQQEIMC